MAITEPKTEHRESHSADEVREHILSDMRTGDYDAAYLGVLHGDEFRSVVYEPDGPRAEEAVTRVSDADAAFHVEARGEKMDGSQFAEGEDQTEFQTLFDEGWDDVVARDEDIPERDEIMDYSPRERAVKAAGTFLIQHQNPLGGLLAALGGGEPVPGAP